MTVSTASDSPVIEEDMSYC